MFPYLGRVIPTKWEIDKITCFCYIFKVKERKDMNKLKHVIANNLIELRKENKLTQQELAGKINYSDNAISRWERAEVTPTIETLELVADFYGVTVTDLLTENFCLKNKNPEPGTILKRVFISLFSISIVWILAILAYIYIDMFKVDLGSISAHAWLVFIAALPVSALVGFYYNRMWGTKILNTIIWSLFTWTLLTTIHLYFLATTGENLFLVYILGVPAQFALVLWFFIRR